MEELITPTGKDELDLPLLDRLFPDCLDWMAERRVEKPRPSALYHFTDMTGLVGILSSKALWACLASCLNDASEMRYGLELAERVIKSRLETADTPFLTEALAYTSDPSSRMVSHKTALPFVVSFCGTIDRSGQWLHYGHSGKGAAIGFDPSSFDRNPSWPEGTQLIRVEYCRERQEEEVSALLDLVQARSRLVMKQDTPEAWCTAGLVFSIVMHLLAPSFKDSCFSQEEEWRLLIYRRLKATDRASPEQQPIAIKYRAAKDQVVPYVELPLSPTVLASVSEVVLGYSSPMKSDDAGLQLLLDQAGIRATGSKSRVQVR